MSGSIGRTLHVAQIATRESGSRSHTTMLAASQATIVFYGSGSRRTWLLFWGLPSAWFSYVSATLTETDNPHSERRESAAKPPEEEKTKRVEHAPTGTPLNPCLDATWTQFGRSSKSQSFS